MWEALFDLLSAALWDPVAKRPRLAAMLWIVVVVLVFGLLVLFTLGR
jgi:hypothetical protein